MTSFFRAVLFAFKNFWRNIWLSLITISILVLALFSVNVLLVVNVVADAASQAIEDKIDVSVFFVPDAPDDAIASTKDYLTNLSQVRAVEFKTKEQAIEEFKRVHAADPKLVESLSELDSNPLGAELIVRAKNTADYPFIIRSLENPQFNKYISKANFEDHKEASEKLNSILNRVRAFGFGLVVLFGLIGILIVFNAVRVAIYTYREEIGIMKLVGASNTFIRAPFWIECLMYSLIAVGITSGIMYSVVLLLAPSISVFFQGANVDLLAYFMQNGLKIMGIQVVALATLCVVSSSLAIGKYLRV
ncbi:MAG: permease-like cell division protein FtsX [bacterium]